MVQVKGKKILITIIPEELISGLVIPEGAKPRPSKGIVYSVGTQVNDYKEGDTVVFPAGVGQEIDIDGYTYLLLTDSDAIIGTLIEDKNELGKVQAD